MGYDYLKSTTLIKHERFCSNCIYKVNANDTDVLTLGIGNIFSGRIIILPQYNFKGKETIVDKLIELYSKFTTRELLEDYYITRDVKCCPMKGYDNFAARSYCNVNLTYELSRLKPELIVIMGLEICSSFERNFNCIHLNNPNCLYFEGRPKEVFIEHFKKVVRYD